MEFSHNKDIDDSLKFEISRFSDSCFDLYKNLIDDNIKNSFDQLYQKIASEIKTNIAQKIGGDDLYNYDSMSEITTFCYDSNINKENYGFYEFNDIVSKKNICLIPFQAEGSLEYKDFMKFVKNEKIIMDYNFLLNDNGL